MTRLRRAATSSGRSRRAAAGADDDKRMADASLALASPRRRPQGGVEKARTGAADEAPAARAALSWSMIAPPRGSGVLPRLRGIGLGILLAAAIVASATGIVMLVALPSAASRFAVSAPRRAARHCRDRDFLTQVGRRKATAPRAPKPASHSKRQARRGKGATMSPRQTTPQALLAQGVPPPARPLGSSGRSPVATGRVTPRMGAGPPGRRDLEGAPRRFGLSISITPTGDSRRITSSPTARRRSRRSWAEQGWTD